jgi:prefoldin subunit 5
MAQQNEEHFEVIDRNKHENYQRRKIHNLEDKIKTLEKSLEKVHKHLSKLIQIIDEIQNKSSK